MNKKARYKILLLFFAIACAVSILSLCIGSMGFGLFETVKALFVDDGSPAGLIIRSIRLPRILVGGLVGAMLAVSGALLQGVMRNNLAGPSVIGVTSGANFVGYLFLVMFPRLYAYLPIGTIIGALVTTLLIYYIAFSDGVNPTRLVLSGVAVSAVFTSFGNLIKSFYTERITNAIGFSVGGLNGVGWETLQTILPYAIVGLLFAMLISNYMNVLLLGDEISSSLGLRTETFRFFAIVISSLLAGASISAAGIIAFVGLIVPHTARTVAGNDYKFLTPLSALSGYILVVSADLIGRTILPVGEVPASVIISFIGAPFFLYLLRIKYRRGAM